MDEAGVNLGTIPLAKALEIAKERGLDLIEISPLAKPPVARILNFDKYRYQQEKKLKKQAANQKQQETKRVQITVRAAQHDLETKAGQANKFLEKGHSVELFLFLKGREKYNKEFAFTKLKEFVKLINAHKVVSAAKAGGNNIMMQIAPN